MKGKYALMLLIALTLVDVLLPFLLIGNIAAFEGSYLFWCVLTLTVILGAAAYMRNWGKR